MEKDYNNNSEDQTGIDDDRSVERLPNLDLNVWIIDDDPVLSRIMMKIVSQWNCNCLHFDTAQPAFDILNRAVADGEQKPNVILLDLEMPGLSGLDFLIKLSKRSNHSDHDNVKPVIIVITGNDIDMERERCCQAGAHVVLSKPVHGAELHRILSQIFHSNN